MLKASFLCLAICLCLASCARFSTTQIDTSHEDGKPLRTLRTKASAYTLLAGRSQLAHWKAAQTDKTQGASVGSLSQEAGGTNLVQTLNAIAALIQSLRPTQ